MAMFDLLSDFVARINNAVIADKKEVLVLKNSLTANVCKKLVRLGYFDSFEEGDDYQIKVVLTVGKINKIKRVSKPGKRVYMSYKDFPKIVGGQGWNILSTSKGILTNHEAKTEQVGGELLFQIY